MYKNADVKSKLIESAIGAGAGAGIGGAADSDNRMRGALVGAGAGAVGAPLLDHLVGKGVKGVYHAGVDAHKNDIKREAEAAYKRYDEYGYFESLDQKIKERERNLKEQIHQAHTVNHGQAASGIIHPNTKDDGRIFGRKFSGMHQDHKEDIDWEILRHTNPDEAKSFAKERASEYGPERASEQAYFRSLRREMKSAKKVRDEELKGGYSFTPPVGYKDSFAYRDLKDLYRRKGMRDEIKRKYMDQDFANEALEGLREGNPNRIFGNLRDLPNNVAAANRDFKTIRGTSERIHGLWPHKDIEPESSAYKAEFRKAYRGIRSDLRDDLRAEARGSYSKTSKTVNNKRKMWSDRAKDISSGSGSGYGNAGVHTRSKDPHDLLHKHNIASGSIKTKKEVDSARRNLAKQYHPDINPSPEAAERMKSINADFDEIQKSDWYRKLAHLHDGTMEKLAFHERMRPMMDEIFGRK